MFVYLFTMKASNCYYKVLNGTLDVDNSCGNTVLCYILSVKL